MHWHRRHLWRLPVTHWAESAAPDHGTTALLCGQ
jgi:hypothetical protein